MRFTVIVPTLNPGDKWPEWIYALRSQTSVPENVIVIDSESDDETANEAKVAGFVVLQVKHSQFNHGGTRQLALHHSDVCDFVIFLTQDAIPSSIESFKRILEPFLDPEIAAVCGRQIPRLNAGHIEAHSRIYNYPDQSSVRRFDDRKTIGIKAAFLSNSFAAYRVSALNEVGGFPRDVIFGEDMYVAAKLLKADYKIAYAADACVFHSHNYSFMQEFERYFDMGVFHAREPWIRQEFGGAEGEGVKYVISELKYLLNHAFWRIPEGMLRTLFRYTGFRLGLMEKRLPLWLKKQLAMNKGFFKG